jgi:hypothetical protein
MNVVVEYVINANRGLVVLSGWEINYCWVKQRVAGFVLCLVDSNICLIK